MEEQCSTCSSSSSDEEFLMLCLNDENRRERLWIHPINKKRKELGEFHHLFQDLKLDEERFYQYFRMTYDNFCELHSLLAPHITKARSHLRAQVSTEERLAVCLRFLSTGDSFRTIAFSYRLGCKTVADIVYEVCAEMWNVLQPIYMPDVTATRWSEVAADFERKWQFPHCIGALDGKHVLLEKPSNSGSLFFNYKKTYSIVLLALVDASCKFITVDVGAYGKSSDSAIFRSSQFGKRFFKNNLNIPADKPLPGTTISAPHVILGDSAFPLQRSLMRPYPEYKLIGHENRKIFNYRLSRARRVSENAFGILSNRFRLYHRKLQMTTEHADTVVLATCILHNFLRTKTNTVLEERILHDANNEEPAGLHDLQRRGGLCSSEGVKARQIFMSYFCSKSGRVPWQYKKVRAGRLIN